MPLPSHQRTHICRATEAEVVLNPFPKHYAIVVHLGIKPPAWLKQPKPNASGVIFPLRIQEGYTAWLSFLRVRTTTKTIPGANCPSGSAVTHCWRSPAQPSPGDRPGTSRVTLEAAGTAVRGGMRSAEERWRPEAPLYLYLQCKQTLQMKSLKHPQQIPAEHLKCY